MKVAIYLPTLGGGGAERAMVTLANALAGYGVTVNLVLASAKGPYLAEVSPTVRVVDLSARRVIGSLPGLVWYLKRERPDCMLTALSHANVIGVIARILAGVQTRLVLSERSHVSRSSVQTPNFRQRVVRALMGWAYRKADAVVAVSEGVANDLAGTIGIERSKISVVYNPVVTPEIQRLSSESLIHPWFDEGAAPVVLTAGRLTPAKDHATLLQAFGDLRRTVDCRLVILGEGELRPQLEAMIDDLGLEGDVLLPGFKENPFPWMKKSSLFVLSSAWEGLPNVLIQAMACGVKVISTDCPSGPDEILEGGRWGRLVPVGDHCALANAMVAALSEANGPDVAGRAADFNVDNAVRGYLRVLMPSEGRH